MNWKNLITPVVDLDAEAARRYMADRSVREYQLLDVRQPKEYEREHLSGGILIPLADLGVRLDELDREKPVIAYCAVGGRSRAAAQYLVGHGFEEVYNLAGGIKAWSAEKATGGLEEGLELFRGDQEYEDALHLAYAMEEGLQQFYGTLAEAAAEPDQRALLMQLAGFENKHKVRLAAEYRKSEGKALEVGDISSKGVMEGGGRIEDMLEKIVPHFETPAEVLEFAMALETQALDLYGRMAAGSGRQSTRELFEDLMDEERGHLGLLTKKLEKLLGS